MSPASSQWQNRGMALALLGILLLVLGFGVAMPVWRVYQAGELELQAKRERIARLRSIASRRDVLEQRLAYLDASVRRGRYTLSEETPNLAAAALQKRVKDIVEQDGGNLKSTRVLSSIQEGRFSRVGINAHMQVSVETLQLVLHELESGTPFLWIDNLTVNSRARRVRRRSPRRGNDSGGTAPLDVRFDLYGLMRSHSGGAGPLP